MEKLVKMLKKIRDVFLVFTLFTVAIPPFTANATIIWQELFVDSDSDSRVGYYSAIDYFALSTSDSGDDMIVIIEPENEASSIFFSAGGSGGVFFDTDGDSVDDISAFAPNRTLSSTNFSNEREIYRGANVEIATGCKSTWTLGSDLTYYAVFIPWRCLGAPVSIRATAWLSNSSGYDFIYGGRTVYPVLRSSISTIVAPTTTVPKVQIPNAPSSVSISQLSETSLRITWLDNSTNEDGFLIQRNDTPVPSGTATSAWPYKTATNSPTIEYGGLTTNRSYCFSISSYNSAGSSSFTDSACYNLQGAVANTLANAPTKSLSCDATRVSSTAKSVQIIVDTGAANAGRTMKFEVFKAGKWIAIGTGRTSKTGASALLANIKIVGKKGSFPIRGTQGSRFICEGNLS